MTLTPRLLLRIGLFGLLGILVVLLLAFGGAQGWLQTRVPISPAEELLEPEACVHTCERSCTGFPTASDTEQCLRECGGWCGEESMDEGF